MITEVFILHFESGIPLLHVNLQEKSATDSPSTVLFSGALQSIRLFLKECKIGDLADFTTNNKRIEIHCECEIVVAVIADIGDPEEKIVEMITQDIAAMFLASYGDNFSKFNGDVTPFIRFSAEIQSYISMRDEEKEDMGGEQHFGLPEGNNSINFIEWLKNRFDPTAEISQGVSIFIPNQDQPIMVDYLLEGSPQKSRC